jgi:hypothetical protein
VQRSAARGLMARPWWEVQEELMQHHTGQQMAMILSNSKMLQDPSRWCQL